VKISLKLKKEGVGCMKKIFFIIFAILFLTGCSVSNNSPDKRIVAQINKYKMTEEDLKYEFKNTPYDEIELLKTENGRKKYLRGLIEKEVLLQEAQRQGIDREKDFMKSIENYWEQALLRILIERKSKEISSLTHVYDNEIEEYYKNSGENLPFSKVKNEIMVIIKQKKETDAMNAWIDELKNSSYIKVDEKVLESLATK